MTLKELNLSLTPEKIVELMKGLGVEEYIDKTKRKTALLFELTTSGIALLANRKDNKISRYLNIK